MGGRNRSNESSGDAEKKTAATTNQAARSERFCSPDIRPMVLPGLSGRAEEVFRRAEARSERALTICSC